MAFKLNNIVVILLMSASLCSWGQNLLRDGKFLQDSVGGKKSDAWRIIPYPLPQGTTIGIDTAVSYSGGRSVRFYSDKVVYYRITQTINLKPKTWYLVNASIKGQNLRTPVSFNSRIIVEGDNYKGLFQMGPGIPTPGEQRNPENFNWRKYSKRFNSGNNRTMTISLCIKASGTAWFDNIEVFEITDDMEKELAASAARALIAKEITTVKQYAEKQKNKKVLEQTEKLAAQLQKWYPENLPERQNGLPFYPFQQKVYSVLSELLTEKYPGQSLIISESSPFKRAGHLCCNLKASDKVDVYGLQGDTEQFALNFTNCTGKEQKITFTLPQGITARKVVEVEVDNADFIDDALVLMSPDKGGKYVFSVPSGMTKQLWFEYKLPQTAGKYNTSINFNSADKSQSINLDTTVVKGKLPEEMPIRTFSYAFPYAGKLTKKRLQECSEDLTRHHQDSWKTEYWFLRYPYGKFDKDGNLIAGSMDWSGIDKQLKQFPNQTRKWLMYLPQRHNTKLLEGVSAKQLSPLWKKCMRQWLTAFVKGLKERGIGYDQILIEWRDEPPKNDLDNVFEAIKFTREVDPKLKIYSNFVSLETPEIKQLVNAVDVIAPEYHRLTPEILKIVKDSGKEFYSYRVQAKTDTPQSIREGFWIMRKNDVKAYSFWCYSDSNNEWQPKGPHSYSMIYGGDPRELTPSKRWEAWREGIEDYALLTMLKAKNPQTYKRIISQYNEENLDTLRKKVLQFLN